MSYILYLSFNPCFNGSFTSTDEDYFSSFFDESFNPCFNGSFTSTTSKGLDILKEINVSILVLMDLSLQPKEQKEILRF